MWSQSINCFLSRFDSGHHSVSQQWNRDSVTAEPRTPRAARRRARPHCLSDSAIGVPPGNEPVTVTVTQCNIGVAT
eukprot:757864-Hanusia_phi.AAC.3